MEMFTRGKKGTQRCTDSCTRVQQLQVHRGFLSAGDMLPLSVLSQEKRERSGKAQWYLISGKSLLECQALPVKEAQLTAQLDACRGHHINNSWFSYRQSFRLAWLYSTVNALIVAQVPTALQHKTLWVAVWVVVPGMLCQTHSWLGQVSGLMEDSDHPHWCGSLVPVEGFLVTFVRLRAHKCPVVRFSSIWFGGVCCSVAL